MYFFMPLLVLLMIRYLRFQDLKIEKTRTFNARHDVVCRDTTKKINVKKKHVYDIYTIMIIIIMIYI